MLIQADNADFYRLYYKPWPESNTDFFHVIVTARLVEGRMVILAVLPDRQKDTVIEN